jgi:hypothetical protein
VIEHNSIVVYQFGCYLPEIGTDPALEICLLKKLDDRQAPKNRIVSVNFSCALVALLDFLTLEDGTNRLSRNMGKGFLLCTP